MQASTGSSSPPVDVLAPPFAARAPILAGLLALAPGCFFNPQDHDPSAGPTGSASAETTAAVTDPTGGPTSGTTDPETTSSPTTAASTTSSTSDATTATTGSPGCQSDAVCQADDPAAPFCLSGACVDCAAMPEPDAACMDRDPALPVCDTGSGSCVACGPDNPGACGGSTPACDAASHTCVGCDEHTDCPATACDRSTGACFSPDRLIFVDVSAQCDIGDGTIAKPFCLISQAIDEIAAGGPSLGWTVKITTGNYTQSELVIPPGTVAAFVGDGGVAKLKSTTAATLQIGANAEIALHKLSFSSNADNPGVTCTGAQIWASDVTLVLNTEGYVGANCDAEFRRAVFYKNTSGGLSVSGGGETRLENTYLSNNGSNATSMYGGVTVSQGHRLSAVYTTILNNLSETGARSLQCSADAGPVEIRNSVLVAFVLPSIACASAVFTQSAIDEGKQGGDTNLQANAADVMTWFEPQISGVYKVKADNALKELAKWTAGDPVSDYNGDPRPNTDGSPDYAGADRPPQ